MVANIVVAQYLLALWVILNLKCAKTEANSVTKLGKLTDFDDFLKIGDSQRHTLGIIQRPNSPAP